MILDLLLYGCTIAFLLTFVGLLMEPVAVRFGWPRRSIWALTLFLSIVIPVVMVMAPHSPKARSTIFSVDKQAFEFGIEKTESTIAPSRMVRPPDLQASAPHIVPDVNASLYAAWIALSVGVIVVWILSWRRLRRQHSEWRRACVDGHQIWITPALGPAVVGFFRPQILMPQWVMEAPSELRSVVLLHEIKHMDAHDPLLLLAGFLAVTLAPWNLPLWWQLRRMRFAVEVDCDARVLRTGAPLTTYGEVLLAVSQQGVLAPLAAMAIAKPRSQLERRIRIMASQASRPAKWLLGVAVMFAMACVAMAIDLPPPTFGEPEPLWHPLHDWSPYRPKAEAAARAAFPDLFKGEFEGTVVVDVELRRDGTVLNIQKYQFHPGPLPTKVRWLNVDVLDLFADLDLNPGSQGRKFFGWFGPQHANGLYVEYRVLKWPHDSTRSSARVRAAVAMQYPEFFHSYPPEFAYQERISKLLTVFMNDDGTINRSQLSDARPEDFEGRRMYEQFLALGLEPEEFGRRSRTWNPQAGHPYQRNANAPHLEILYAWAHHPDDPPDVVFQSRADFDQASSKQRQEMASEPEEALLKRYFPDIWENTSVQPVDQLWMVFDTRGELCETGRGHNEMSEIMKYLDERFPRARIKHEMSTGAKTANGNEVGVNYFRLDDDSSATECKALAAL